MVPDDGVVQRDRSLHEKRLMRTLLIETVLEGCEPFALFSQRHTCTPAFPARGRSKRKLRGIPTLGTKVERAKRSGGLQKRSADDWGGGLCAREGGRS